MFDYYLISTPLHMFVSSALALHRARKCIAIFIDQYEGQSDCFVKNLRDKESGSPFDKVFVFGGREVSLLQKKAFRKQLFKELAEIVEQYAPNYIFCGNDRRIEFQFLMHHSRKNHPQVEGVYLDEGLFSYVGREASKSFSDRYVDTFFKKLAYGNWWSQPPTVGAGKWITSAYLAYPEQGHPLIQRKKMQKIDPEWFYAPHFVQLTQHWLACFDVDQEVIENSRVVLTLPQDRNMRLVPGYVDRVYDLVDSLSSSGYGISVKYHPSEQQLDPLQVSSRLNVSILPAKIPFEVLLPFMPRDNAFVIGDMSSTLIMTRLFRPDVGVLAIKPDQENRHFKQFADLYQKMDIPVLPMKQIIDTVMENTQ
ncbi:polysialyltransferase family glycosyltransferase [Thiomicrorhabdus heinhorstiae]|uniref:Uncharacterized protein n=1 Tax=Thiomicrorhabdus heinhorstiae TaxID=2748010 RepID=A0ABS0C2X7_9GAMM|nr:polysialyltransferase family glycosyltransferase [Thiomicrorhabdus heinhorstiae]MBF6058637.1 hypothetical protein [Thiomicrorhabdus heinhorstiae]